MKTTRMPPWDLSGDLWDKLNQIKTREQRPWRWMLTKGVELFIEGYEAKNGLVRLPGVDVLPAVSGGVSPVAESRAVALPAAAPAAAPVPAVELSVAGKLVARLREMIEQSETDIAAAQARLLVQPDHIPSQTRMRVLPARLVEDQAALVEAEAVLAAELSSKQIDNGENEVED